MTRWSLSPLRCIRPVGEELLKWSAAPSLSSSCQTTYCTQAALLILWVGSGRNWTPNLAFLKWELYWATRTRGPLVCKRLLYQLSLCHCLCGLTLISTLWCCPGLRRGTKFTTFGWEKDVRHFSNGPFSCHLNMWVEMGYMGYLKDFHCRHAISCRFEQECCFVLHAVQIMQSIVKIIQISILSSTTGRDPFKCPFSS